MRVLQICLKPPLPEIDGGCKAMNNITQGLLQNNIKVKVLTASTYKHPFQKEKLSKEYLAQTQIENVFINTKVNAFSAFVNLFSSRSYNVERFYNQSFEALIKRTLEHNQYDIVLLESLYVSKYMNVIRKNSSAKIIYRAHNVESEIWKRNVSQEKGLKKFYIKLLTNKLQNYEQKMLNQFDGIAAISSKDKENLQDMGCTIPIEVFPFGIKIDDYDNIKAEESADVFHIGSMDWKPNQMGIKWFLNNVWSIVVKEELDVKFNLAGKDMPDWLLSYQKKNVNIIGEVEDAKIFIGENSIMVVPLFVASGMRIKIIEAMAMGKLVIATSMAAEGISFIDGENIIIANTKEEFAQAIVRYIKNKEEQKRIAENAKELVRLNYDNQLIVNTLAKFFKKIIN